MTAAVRKKEKRVQRAESRVGLKMKHMRLLKGLTLKKLASLAHCSESMLSRVENGSANPSIKTMHRVALALNMPVSGLFQGADDEDGGNVVLRQGERPTVEAGQGKGHKLEALIPSRSGNLLSGYINDMANGSICVALGWSGDINIARQRAIDGKTGQKIEALIPKNGGILFFDVMVIPADAPHPENAHKFIDYIMRPEVHAGLTNKVFYANPNKESKKFIKPEVAANPTVFPSDADMAKMAAPDAINNDLRRTMTRMYTSFKTGL